MSNLYFVYFEPQIDDEIIEHIENIKFIKCIVLRGTV